MNNCLGSRVIYAIKQLQEQGIAPNLGNIVNALADITNRHAQDIQEAVVDSVEAGVAFGFIQRDGEEFRFLNAVDIIARIAAGTGGNSIGSAGAGAMQNERIDVGGGDCAGSEVDPMQVERIDVGAAECGGFDKGSVAPRDVEAGVLQLERVDVGEGPSTSSGCVSGYKKGDGKSCQKRLKAQAVPNSVPNNSEDDSTEENDAEKDSQEYTNFLTYVSHALCCLPCTRVYKEANRLRSTLSTSDNKFFYERENLEHGIQQLEECGIPSPERKARILVDPPPTRQLSVREIVQKYPQLACSDSSDDD